VVEMKRLLFFFGIMFLLLGCIGGGETPQNETNVTPTQEKPTVVMPSFILIGPDEGEVFTTEGDYGSINVVLSTSNLIIRPAGTRPNKIGEGHFAISLDNGDKTYIFTKNYVLDGISPGAHTLRVELVHNDNSPYSPPIVKTVNFYIEKAVTEYVPKEYVVIIHDFSYEPETITVNVGDTITWVNNGAYPRSATYTGVFDTQIIPPGQNASVKMTTPGTFRYYDLTFMAMKGTVIVNQPE